MTVDLEARVRAELAARAADAGVLPLAGAALRETARRRRTRPAACRCGRGGRRRGRHRGCGGASRSGRTMRPRRRSTSPRPPRPPPRPSPTRPGCRCRSPTRPTSRCSRRPAATPRRRPLLTARLPSGRVVVLVATERVDPRLWVAGATLASDQPGAPAVSGTSGHFPSYDSLIAVPVRDGDRTVLVVLLPGRLGDTVEATTSRPGEPVRRTSAFVHDRFALVPVTSPESVTRVRVLARGRAVVDTIPAGSLLGPDVPRTVDRVVATSAGPPTQPVQVRTDGRTACRLTVGSFWDGPAYVPWNPFDAACAPVDGRLHLLLAADRRYSSVAGVAPAGTSVGAAVLAGRVHQRGAGRATTRCAGLRRQQRSCAAAAGAGRGARRSNGKVLASRCRDLAVGSRGWQPGTSSWSAAATTLWWRPATWPARGSTSRWSSATPCSAVRSARSSAGPGTPWTGARARTSWSGTPASSRTCGWPSAASPTSTWTRGASHRSGTRHEASSRR